MDIRNNALFSIKEGDKLSLDRKDHDDLKRSQIRFLMCVEKDKKLDNYMILAKDDEGACYFAKYKEFFEDYRIGGEVEYEEINTVIDGVTIFKEFHIIKSNTTWIEGE